MALVQPVVSKGASVSDPKNIAPPDANKDQADKMTDGTSGNDHNMTASTSVPVLGVSSRSVSASTIASTSSTGTSSTSDVRKVSSKASTSSKSSTSSTNSAEDRHCDKSARECSCEEVVTVTARRESESSSAEGDYQKVEGVVLLSKNMNTTAEHNVDSCDSSSSLATGALHADVFPPFEQGDWDCSVQDSSASEDEDSQSQSSAASSDSKSEEDSNSSGASSTSDESRSEDTSSEVDGEDDNDYSSQESCAGFAISQIVQPKDHPGQKISSVIAARDSDPRTNLFAEVAEVLRYERNNRQCRKNAEASEVALANLHAVLRDLRHSGREVRAGLFQKSPADCRDEGDGATASSGVLGSSQHAGVTLAAEQHAQNSRSRSMIKNFMQHIGLLRRHDERGPPIIDKEALAQEQHQSDVDHLHQQGVAQVEDQEEPPYEGTYIIDVADEEDQDPISLDSKVFTPTCGGQVVQAEAQAGRSSSFSTRTSTTCAGGSASSTSAIDSSCSSRNEGSSSGSDEDSTKEESTSPEDEHVKNPHMDEDKIRGDTPSNHNEHDRRTSTRRDNDHLPPASPTSSIDSEDARGMTPRTPPPKCTPLSVTWVDMMMMRGVVSCFLIFREFAPVIVALLLGCLLATVLHFAQIMVYSDQEDTEMIVPLYHNFKHDLNYTTTTSTFTTFSGSVYEYRGGISAGADHIAEVTAEGDLFISNGLFFS